MAKGLMALYTSREGTHYFHKLDNSASLVLSKLTKIQNNANYN